MTEKNTNKLFLAAMFMAAILFFCFSVKADTGTGSSKDLDMGQARILNYEGLVEVSRAGKPVSVRKGTALNGEDEVIVYYDSFLELYFGNNRENIFRIEGENSFILADMLKSLPYGFEVRFDPRTKTTQTIFVFSEESWGAKYLELLQKGRIPYTVVFVREGVVATENVDILNPKEILVKQGQMTYVFKDKNPFAAMPWEEYIDMCIEDCWGEW
ncbi:MAG: hypothetical protein PHU91_05725 [Candidatus Omnitrophica bacterium]|nr:hypothetical protein [Candidatus Omnitrophota bacterium]MDD5237141.1 hypothetical protein [Candidatus Omnitrophota bacterium]MDD5610625.1 hypothetical protein [Candidatus Omnitrophota bacterium]